MSDSIFTVSELLRIVNLDLGSRYGNVAVEGEVTNFTRSGPGHCYFTIKDAESQIQIVLFSQYARGLKFSIDQGLFVIVRGKLNIYGRRGTFQLNAVAVEPKGVGSLQLAFEQLKERLEKEGLFAAERKRPIPMLPQRIAIVSSPQGAAIRDILHVLGRRFEGLEVQIFPVRVQGDESAGEIARALDHLSRWNMHDVVIVSRGGGSLEDLWPFNEEIVARAIASCSVPVISGVGHETDFTIADFVADLRAPTPSAAAEIVVKAKDEICLQIDHAVSRIHRIIESRVGVIRHDLRDLSSADRLRSLPHRIAATRRSLEQFRMTLYRRLERLSRTMRDRLQNLREPLAAFPSRLAIESRRKETGRLEETMHRLLHHRIERDRHQLSNLVHTLEAVSPLSVLARGYAIAFTDGKKRKVLKHPDGVQIGDSLHIQLSGGSLQCTVDGKTLGLESVLPPLDDMARPERAGRRRTSGRESKQKNLELGDKS
ncbi:MAG: exodeoxyribonuclease VII large subunit [Acidobacteria bacterium]|nr:exodeoxyribonuclease VII large subunit [Acidobacteriota bacterium]